MKDKDELKVALVEDRTGRTWTAIDSSHAEAAFRERQAWLHGQQKALEAALNGAPLKTSLGELVRTATDGLGRETRAGFCLSNADGTSLHHVVGMPAAYAEAVDGFKIGPESLACGLATHTGQAILTSDVTKDSRWKPWVWLAERFDFRGCWSFPIHTSAGKFVGAFTVYSRQPREPTERDLELAWLLTHTASIIISRHMEWEARQHAEQGLRESLAFNQALVTSMGEGLYTVDTQGRVTYMNPAAERYFGWSSAEILGRKIHEVIHYRYPDGSAFPADECPSLQVLQQGTTLLNQEDVFIRKDGTSFHVIYSSAPIKGEDGTTSGLVVAFHDITERKKTAEALESSRQALRVLAARLNAAREKERTELAREIHDELSGTLTALKMDLSLLPGRLANNYNVSEKLSSMSELIDRALDRVREIATDLRPVVLDKLGLAAAIEWQLREFERRSGIACDACLPNEEYCLDPRASTAVFRIFQEALTNIARHAKATKVFVDLRRKTGSLVLKVCDDGIGIDETAIQGKESIGLLGMRERALAFGGTVEIAASPKGGTLVKVNLPMT